MRYPIPLMVALSALVLTGCGSESGTGDDVVDSPHSATVLGQEYPHCADVWIEGEVIPEDYEGCMVDADTLHAAVSRECNDGTELTGFEDEGLFAFIGGEVQMGGPESAEYSAAFDECLGPF